MTFEQLEEILTIYRNALQEIMKYGEYPHNQKDDGCCPYGCDCPYIAKNALKEVADLMQLEKLKK